MEMTFQRGTAGTAWLAAGLGLAILVLPASRLRAERASRAREPRLRFEANHGQIDGHIKFEAHSADFNLFLTEKEADVVLHQEAEPQGPVARGKTIVVLADAEVLRLRFVDSNPPTRISPLVEPSLMRDPSSRPAPGSSGAGGHFFSGIAYQGIYPGIDVVYRGTARRIGFGLLLSPGADADGIVLELGGATRISLDRAGNALVHAGKAAVILERPTFLAAHGSERIRLRGGYRIEPHNRLRFVVALPQGKRNLMED